MVIYMPMILELPIAMLACTRIGAVHSVVVSKVNADDGRFIMDQVGRRRKGTMYMIAVRRIFI